MTSEVYFTKRWLTMRAADLMVRAAFFSGFRFSPFKVGSPPSHLPLTQAVGLLLMEK